MKKQAFVIAFLAAAGFMGAAQAADGTITFNGELTSVTCSVHGGAAGAANGDFQVTLPTLSTSAVTAAGAGSTGFKIVVGGAGDVGCTDGTLASVHFESSSPMIDAATGNLKLNPSSTATNVQVQITDAGRNNAPINLFTNTTSAPVAIVNNTATLPFSAQYVASGAGAPTAGTVNTDVQYSISFN